MDTILVIDDDAAILDLIAGLLDKPDREILKSHTAEEGLKIIRNDVIDLIFTDINMPGMNGIDFITQAHKINGTAPIIVITAYASTETAIKALRAGAYDYLTKPFAHEELLKICENTLQAQHLFQEVTYLRGKLDTAYTFENIIGQCPAMQHIFGIIRRIRDADCNVLITGPSGTGKDIVAQVIHNTSNRKDGPYIPINCTSIPENLLESELFGHIRGSFTGAVNDKTGLLEAAHGGTLFLDEIGDMPMNLQPKLLRVLQDHKVKKVGSTEWRTVDIRIIAATHQNLEKIIHNGTFREDLYYRLSVVELKLPPLEERGSDISLLASHFLKLVCTRLNKIIHGFCPEVRKVFTTYPWPGNIRELENAIEHAATLCQSDTIDVSDLPARLQAHTESANFLTGSLDERIEQFERHCLRTALEKVEYDFAAAARQLDTSLPTLYRKAKKYKLVPYNSRIIDIPDTRRETRKKQDKKQPYLFEPETGL